LISKTKIRVRTRADQIQDLINNRTHHQSSLLKCHLVARITQEHKVQALKAQVYTLNQDIQDSQESQDRAVLLNKHLRCPEPNKAQVVSSHLLLLGAGKVKAVRADLVARAATKVTNSRKRMETKVVRRKLEEKKGKGKEKDRNLKEEMEEMIRAVNPQILKKNPINLTKNHLQRSHLQGLKMEAMMAGLKSKKRTSRLLKVLSQKKTTSMISKTFATIFQCHHST
jgi:hypothetical protein